MKESNRQFLDATRWVHESYSQSSPPRLLGFLDREKMRQVIRDEFDPNYTTDLWCDSCIKSMVLNCYNYYDQYLKNEKEGTE